MDVQLNTYMNMNSSTRNCGYADWFSVSNETKHSNWVLFFSYRIQVNL